MAHREQKTTFGLGEPQCWSVAATVAAVRFAGWLDGVVLLTGRNVWGLGRAPAGTPTTRWWRGSGRWTTAQVLTGLRAEVWDQGEFRPVWAGTPANWPDMTDWAAAQTNALLSASHT